MTDLGLVVRFKVVCHKEWNTEINQPLSLIASMLFKC